MKLIDQHAGLLFAIAGVSKRADCAPVSLDAIEFWLHDDRLRDMVGQSAVWLFRTGLIQSADGKCFSVSNSGWEALTCRLAKFTEYAQIEEGTYGLPLFGEEPSPAAGEVPEVLTMIGEFLLKKAR